MPDNQKIQKFFKILQKNKIDATLIFNASNQDKHVYYFTQLDVEYIFLLFLSKQQKLIILTSILEAERVKNTLPYEVITISKSPLDIINKILKENKIKTLSLNYNSITLNQYNNIKPKLKYKLKDCSNLLALIRQQKTEQELQNIKKACEITDNVFILTIENINKFKTELDIAKFIKNKFHENGVEESFPAIVASGKNAAIPHYSPKDIALNPGFCVIDFGCKYNSYCADMTRTIYFGNPTKKELDLYNSVLTAKKQAELSVKLNNSCSIPDKIARKSLGKLQKNFIHSLGHGLGLDVHEAPNLSAKSRHKFLENTVFTIEPGIYFAEKLGIRIEDDYIISKNGLKKLTKSSEELIIVPK